MSTLTFTQLLSSDSNHLLTLPFVSESVVMSSYTRLYSEPPKRQKQPTLNRKKTPLMAASIAAVVLE